jgi:RNA:NAD 2'-phosphotransferase (TPT1/KptA family)
VPAGKLIHAVMDNYGTHKHPKVLAWLERHPRWTFHFTPTSCSWLNAVETFFSKLTRRRLRRGSFHSLVALQEVYRSTIMRHRSALMRPWAPGRAERRGPGPASCSRAAR